MAQTVDRIHTYEEYEEALRQEAQRRLQTAQRAADTLYGQSVQSAEKQRGQAMTAADNAFDRSKSTYGLTAEYLAQSGLNSSGLSDNMMRDAYSARQSGYSAAGATYADLVDEAERKKANAYLNAELDYNDRTSPMNDQLATYRQNILDAYNLALENVDGQTTQSEINAYIVGNGLSYAQAQALYKKAGLNPPDYDQYVNDILGGLMYDNSTEQEGDKKPGISPEVLKEFETLKSSLGAVGTQGGMTAEAYKALFDKLSKDQSLASRFGSWLAGNKDALLASGIITQEQIGQGGGLSDIFDTGVKTNDIINLLKSYPGRKYEGGDAEKAKALFARLANLYEGEYGEGEYGKLPAGAEEEIKSLLATEFANGKTYADFLKENGIENIPFLDKAYKGWGDQKPQQNPNYGQYSDDYFKSAIDEFKQISLPLGSDADTVKAAFDTLFGKFGDFSNLSESQINTIKSLLDEKVNGNSEKTYWDLVNESEYTIPDKFRGGDGTKVIKLNYKAKNIDKLANPSDGENFRIKPADSNTEDDENNYRVQIAEKASDDVAKAASDLENGAIFVYGNTPYIKIGGAAYSIGQRSLGWLGQQTDYNDFANIVQKAIDENNLGDVSYDVVGELKEGNKVNVSDSLRRNYTLKVGKEITNTAIRAAAADLDDEKVFTAGEKVYIKSGNGADYKVYELEKKAGQGRSYELIMENASEFTPEGFDKPLKDAVEATKGYNVKAEIGDDFKLKVGGYDLELESSKNDDATYAAKEKGFTSDSMPIVEYAGEYYYLQNRNGTDAAYKIKDVDAIKSALGILTSESMDGVKKVSDATVRGDKTITVTYGDKTYSVKANESAGDDVETIAEKLGVKSGELFVSDGELYAKTSTGIYKVKARPNSKTGNYASLMSALGDEYGVGYGAAFTLSDVDDMSKGDDIILKDVDGKEHVVESAGLATDVTAPSGIPDNVPFIVKDKAYIKVNGKVYGIRKKNVFYTNSYKSLIEKLKASQG